MAKVYVFMADGFEDTEFTAPVDLLRRAGNDVVTVSIMGRTDVLGAHGIRMMADRLFDGKELTDGDCYILPGGGEGTANLNKCAPLRALLRKRFADGAHIAAICAAPSVLAGIGMLEGRKAICYPGMEDCLTGADVITVPAVTDGNVTTGRGPGAAIDFGLELISVLNGAEKASEIKEAFVYKA